MGDARQVRQVCSNVRGLDMCLRRRPAFLAEQQCYRCFDNQRGHTCVRVKAGGAHLLILLPHQRRLAAAAPAGAPRLGGRSRGRPALRAAAAAGLGGATSAAVLGLGRREERRRHGRRGRGQAAAAGRSLALDWAAGGHGWRQARRRRRAGLDRQCRLAAGAQQPLPALAAQTGERVVGGVRGHRGLPGRRSSTRWAPCSSDAGSAVAKRVMCFLALPVTPQQLTPAPRRCSTRSGPERPGRRGSRRAGRARSVPPPRTAA